MNKIQRVMYHHSILLNDIINVNSLKQPRPCINYTVYTNDLMKELVAISAWPCDVATQFA